jgi:integrase
MVYAQRLVRAARDNAGLPAHVTLDACRHGGLTELGDSGVSEQGGMSLTGHSTPQAFRLYVKRTETQRMIAARQRRAWVEANEMGSSFRIGRQDKFQNEHG